MEVIPCSETSVHIGTALPYISEDGNFHNWRYENVNPIKTSKYFLFYFTLDSKLVTGQMHYSLKEQEEKRFSDLPGRKK
jgi:hypothetical protein